MEEKKTLKFSVTTPLEDVDGTFRPVFGGSTELAFNGTPFALSEVLANVMDQDENIKDAILMAVEAYNEVQTIKYN